MRTFPHRARRLLLTVPLALGTACGAVNAPNRSDAPPAPRTAESPAAAPLVAPRQEPPPVDPGVVERAVRAVEPNATVGALVVDRRTGATPLRLNADRPFRSASLVKLLIAVDVLERGAGPVDRGRLTTMLGASDDAVASSYWVLGGRADIVVRTAARLGLTGARPPEDPGAWGEVVLTATDVVRIYQHVLVMPPADRSLVLDALARAPRTAADGFDQHFGIAGGLGPPWAVKQGWGNNGAAMVLHSTGLVGPDRRYLVVLLTEHPLGSGWQTAASSVTAGAAALRGRLPGL